MLNTLGIVQVRDGAWPPTKTSRKLGGKPLVEWVVRRVTDCTRLDGVIVVAGGDPVSLVLPELVPADVPFYLAKAGDDALDQVLGALEQYRAKAVVRVCADNPYVDPVLIDQLVTTASMHAESDYISFRSRRSGDNAASPLGVFAEWCSTKALKIAGRQAQEPGDRDQVTRYIYSRPSQFHVRLLPVPPELDRDDLRLRIDFEEDWDHAQVIYDALDPHDWDWRRLAGLLDQQPALRQRMAVLNSRGEKE